MTRYDNPQQGEHHRRVASISSISSVQPHILFSGKTPQGSGLKHPKTALGAYHLSPALCARKASPTAHFRHSPRGGGLGLRSLITL